jgi:hypothetical protein
MNGRRTGAHGVPGGTMRPAETDSLLFKEDWAGTKERFIRWWNRDYFGRCGLAVRSPRDNPPDIPPPPPPRSPERRNHDPEWISRNMDYELGRTFFGGEAFPVWNDGYRGYLGLPTMLGCTAECGPDTSWMQPNLLDPENLDVGGFQLDESDPVYRMKSDLDARAVRECAGKSIPSLGAFGGSGDTLAAMRGTEQLLLDCVDRPEAVQRAEERLMDIWIDYHDRCFRALNGPSWGSTCWFNLWSPGRFYAAQNDFSYNIGPDMFRRLFLPVIRRQTEYLDHAVYHVDGIGAFHHIDALLELPRLQAIQVLPGAGKPGPLHYLPVLRKVQAAGKNLHISLPVEEVERALALLSARGLFIDTTARTETEARGLLEKAESWSVDRG